MECKSRGHIPKSGLATAQIDQNSKEEHDPRILKGLET